MGGIAGRHQYGGKGSQQVRGVSGVFKVEVLDGFAKAVERALHGEGVRRIGKIRRITGHVKWL